MTLDALAASGSVLVTEAVAGRYDYKVACGAGTRIATVTRTIEFVTPAVMLYAIGSERRVGSSIELRWYSLGETCTPSGGQSTEGWQKQRYVGGDFYGYYYSPAATAGTFTYRLTCTAGALAASAEVTVTVSDAAAYVELAADRTSLTVGDTATLTWRSNADQCTQFPFSDTSTGVPADQRAMSGSARYTPDTAGVRTFTYACNVAGQGRVVRSVDIQAVARANAPATSQQDSPVAAPATSGSSAASSGGGGALDPLLLALLGGALALTILRRAHRDRPVRG